MKIVSLNTWGGRVYKPLLEFFKTHSDVDVFCLQEVYHNAVTEVVKKENFEDALNLHTDIQEILTEYQGYFRPHVDNCYGLAIFAKKDLKVEEEGDIMIFNVHDYKKGANHSRNLQYLKLKNLTIANVHGLWNGKGKTDTEERLDQSKIIKGFLETTNTPNVLCGDLNLLPDTKSIEILELAGMKNLIKEFAVTSTRTSYYTKPEKFADYMFVTPDINVVDFKVLPEEVSDHSALLLEI